MKLNDDWRRAHTFISNRAMTSVIAVNGVYACLDPGLQAAIPHVIVTGLSCVLLVIGIIGTLIKQDCKDDGNTKND